MSVFSPKYSIPESQTQGSKPYLPGPGQYNPKEKEAQITYSVPKAPRQTLHENIQSVPGPGSYDLEIDIGGPKYKISNAQRYKDKKYSLPGPGAYTIKSEKQSPSYSMSAKRTKERHESNPGPGAYSPSVSSNSVYYSIGRSQHFKISNKNSPGPSTYNLSETYTKGSTIGNGKRPPLSLINDTPGPGAYNILSKIKTPAYSISTKNNLKKLDSDPVRHK